MFGFAQPYFLLLLAALGFAAWRVCRRRSAQGMFFSAAARFSALAATWRMRVAAVAPLLFLAGLVLLILALAGPRTLFDRATHASEAIAIQMVVDISGSMEALDFSTPMRRKTRLDAVKDVFAEFVKNRSGDLAGLITFGGYAATRVPLTLDHKVLRQALEAVEIPRQMADGQGRITNEQELMTAIGDALAAACSRLEKAEVKSKIIILLSDGESNTGAVKPEEALQAAKALGIKIYTIGIGSTGRAPVLARDIFGREMIRYAWISMDEELLRKMAEETGGRYFNARDPRGLARTLEDIDRLEKTEVRRDVYSRYNEHFHWPLGIGLAMLVAAACLNFAAAGRIA